MGSNLGETPNTMAKMVCDFYQSFQENVGAEHYTTASFQILSKFINHSSPTDKARTVKHPQQR
jgi:hypothetical protein